MCVLAGFLWASPDPRPHLLSWTGCHKHHFTFSGSPSCSVKATNFPKGRTSLQLWTPIFHCLLAMKFFTFYLVLPRYLLKKEFKYLTSSSNYSNLIQSTWSTLPEARLLRLPLLLRTKPYASANSTLYVNICVFQPMKSFSLLLHNSLSRSSGLTKRWGIKLG